MLQDQKYPIEGSVATRRSATTRPGQDPVGGRAGGERWGSWDHRGNAAPAADLLKHRGRDALASLPPAPQSLCLVKPSWEQLHREPPDILGFVEQTKGMGRIRAPTGKDRQSPLLESHAGTKTVPITDLSDELREKAPDILH